jgi:hypothetical protein
VARAVEDHGGNGRGLYALGFGQIADVFIGRRVKIDEVFGITGTDRNLFHVDIGRMQERAALGHCQRRDRAGHILGA